MKITIDTNSYNVRRYGKPWIAKITLVGNDLKFRFGTWIGDHGSEGVLILEDMEPGDFFAQGGKDFRKPRNSAPDYYELNVEGVGTKTTKANVYKALAT